MSLIADSLKKIEKGENDTSSKEQGFLAPPLMQKDFGGSNKGGKGGKKGPSKLLLIIILVLVIGVGGTGAFLYMTGVFDSLLAPEPIKAVRPVRNMSPVAENVQENVQEEVAVVTTDKGKVVQENIIDFIQTESAQDMNPALLENMTVNNVIPTDNITVQKGIEWKEDVVEAKKDNVTKEKTTEVTKKQTVKNTTTTNAKKTTTTNATKTTPKEKKVTTTKNAVKDSKKIANNFASVPKTTYPKVTPKNTKVDNVKPKTVIPKVQKPVTIDDKLTYTSLIAQGEKAVDAKDYESAINLFKKAGEIYNSNVLMGNIASLYIKIAKPAIASEIVIVNKITDPSIISSLVIDMADNKYLVQALVLLKYASKNLPVNSQIVYAEGFYYEVQRGYVKASEYYLKAFEMNPREPAYLYAYARCLDFSEQYYKALENYVKVVAMKPDNKLKIIAEQRIRSLQGYLRNDK